MENIKQTTSEVRVLDIFFKSIKFNQIRGAQGQIKINIKHRFELAKSNDKKNVKLTVTTQVSDDEARLDLELQSVIIIGVEDNTNLPQGFDQFALNTLYPYIRSQVTLITTQPGIMPIALPILPPKIKGNDNNQAGTIYA